MIHLLVFNFLCGLIICCAYYIDFEPHDWPEILPPKNFYQRETVTHSDYSIFHNPPLQSPIDITYTQARKVKLQPLKFENMPTMAVPVIVKNTGKTVSLKLADQRKRKIQLTGGPLFYHGKYVLDSTHIHWGRSDFFGSEHKINGERFAIEGHAVHFNSKYRSLSEAKKYKDGLAVVAFFGKVAEQVHPKFERLVELLPYITYPNTSVMAPTPACFEWYDELVEPNGYYTYPGSLTSHPFTENVFWIVYPKVMNISSSQIAAFRRLQTTEYTDMTENNRPTKALNGRPLLYAT